MREISVNTKATELPFYTFLNYGNTRTGKTVFGATFPRPFIIADVTEGGYQSILNMDRSLWFEPDVEPIIVGIDEMNDFVTSIIPRLMTEIARKRVLTIVWDAFSFYTDFFLAKLINLQTAAGKAVDNRQAYGSLGIHLRNVRTDLHKFGVNVVWNCLAKHPDESDPKGSPLIPGQQGDKFSAGVDFLFHSRLEQKKDQGKIVGEEYQIRTRQFGNYIAGNRLGMRADTLPDPFVGTYSDLLGWLGYDLEAVRAALPKIQAAPTITAGTKPAAPPIKPAAGVVITRPSPKVVSPQAGNNQAPRGAANVK